jgi:type 1 glutamine amidotransferase
VANDDIEVFLPTNLAKYDAVVLNNTCPDREDRDVFRDVLINKLDEYGGAYAGRSLEQREALARELFNSLVRYVADGGGLVVLHGGIANFNYSDEFSELVGGSFDYHPPQQEVILKPVDASHPLLSPFNGEPFVHHDEPYLFNRAYPALNFHPLLEMDVSNLSTLKQFDEIRSMPRYAAWIKRHGEGRVFYCSPAHNPASFEDPALLGFILRGIQYATGDLECPDAPIGTGESREN